MLFNSANYIVFFIIVLILYYALPYKLSRFMLLIASLIFYMAWEPALILLILFSALSNFGLSLMIERHKDKRVKKRLYILSLIINFGLLAVFKYLAFLSRLIFGALGLAGLSLTPFEPNIILPMGISFYTFQAAAYTTDVYRGDIEAVRNPFEFTLFITFFPQLVAGPIERAKKLLSQLSAKHPFRAENIVMGVKLMIIGYFKKVVIADRLAVAVDTIFANPKDFDGFSFIVGALLFTIQIFCDFSGYSDIAIGTAKTMGISLMTNFDRPYFSRSIKEFWRRWHISLSTWFKDYVYIPLGGSRVSKPRWAFNIMVTFILSGLWHGANLTFVFWGALHGAFQIIGRIKSDTIGRLCPKNFFTDIISGVITFALVVYAWIFFRADTLTDAFYITAHLGENLTQILNPEYIYASVTSWGLGLYPLILSFGSVLILFFMELISFKGNITSVVEKTPFPIRFGFYFCLVFIIISTGVFDSGAEFIYFQF
ncbi:MAG: MBOAT family protein [Clostridiales bacterium]|nr:MBOAT family protein [Clostridiales bacterium]